MEKLKLTPIGTIGSQDGGTVIRLEKKYAPALNGLEGFSHLQVVWWFDGCDNAGDRGILTEPCPYVHGPETLGVFATRSPMRPNPIALTCAAVTFLDIDEGLVGLDFLDAHDGSPVIDLKPFTPSLDRVQSHTVPDWCAHWPDSREASGDFDWGAEFRF